VGKLVVVVSFGGVEGFDLVVSGLLLMGFTLALLQDDNTNKVRIKNVRVLKIIHIWIVSKSK
jgi:hypothetical protein